MAVVEGKLVNENIEALFRASVACAGIGPVGSIFGSVEAEIGGVDYEYIFRAGRPSRVITSIAGGQRTVFAVFPNAIVTNITSSFTVFNGTITLNAVRSSSGIITASLTILRPGRVTLRASSTLQHGVLLLTRSVSCSR